MEKFASSSWTNRIDALLTVSDTKIVTIALEGLENILKVGEEDAAATNSQNANAISSARISHTATGTASSRPRVIRLGTSR